MSTAKHAVVYCFKNQSLNDTSNTLTLFIWTYLYVLLVDLKLMSSGLLFAFPGECGQSCSPGSRSWLECPLGRGFKWTHSFFFLASFGILSRASVLVSQVETVSCKDVGFGYHYGTLSFVAWVLCSCISFSADTHPFQEKSLFQRYCRLELSKGFLKFFRSAGFCFGLGVSQTTISQGKTGATNQEWGTT